MPQPLKKPVRNTYIEIENKRPEHLAAIGLVIVRWSGLENAVSSLFSQLLTYAMSPGSLGDKPLLLRPSHIILDGISNMNARLKLVTKIAATTLEPDDQKLWSKTHAPAIKNLGAQRAKVAHGKWGWSDEHADDLILNPHPMMRYSVRDLTRLRLV